ncbi:hypothetical protein, partial [Oceanicoccus sp.]|uniref:hypothetical protein n=1 Tax=Oceanicoccus sp. TaxID=2691044 RepID=UPI002627C682
RNSDVTNGINGLLVKYRRPGCSRIRGFPHSARANRRIPRRRVVLINGNISNTPRLTWSTKFTQPS